MITTNNGGGKKQIKQVQLQTGTDPTFYFGSVPKNPNEGSIISQRQLIFELSYESLISDWGIHSVSTDKKGKMGPR